MQHLTPNLALSPLQAVQLEAKLRHCAKRLRSIAYDIAARSPSERTRSLGQCRAEVIDCIRYLQDIEGGFPRGLSD